MDLKDRVQRFIDEQGLIGADDTVLCGVSGGADSLCLFILLHELYKDSKVSLHVMHIHHHLRESADSDAAFVRRLCDDLSVPFSLKDVDVEAFARTMHGSTEEAARVLRYRAFEDKLKELESIPSKRCLAIAHNMNDDAETVLHNLFRGSGLKGLGGIRPVQDKGEYRLIRPLLDIARDDIEAFLQSRGLSWCTDETNLGDDYARNRIRHNLLPLAASQINAGAVLHIHKAAYTLSEAEDYISLQLDEAFRTCTEEIPDGIKINRAAFASLHPYLKKRLILKCLEYVSGYAKDITATHVDLLCGLFSLPAGKMLDMPHKLHALRYKEYVELVRK